jgi:hypothetical protein
MTMSKYERRVLAELEAELSTPEGRWASGRAALRRMRRGTARTRGVLRHQAAALGVIVLAVAACVPTIIFAPDEAAASVTAVLGAIAGCVATVLWRTPTRTFGSRR